MRTARALAALALAGGVLSTTACDLTELGGYRPAAAPSPAATPAPTPVLGPQVIPVATAPTTVLRARAVARFGTLAVDAAGRTLYRSDKDSARPPTSRCAGACLAAWRPALVTGTDFTVVGVDWALVGTVRRAGGARQLTLAGWPLYTFSQDRRPGDVKGVCKAGFSPVTPEGAKSAMRG